MKLLPIAVLVFGCFAAGVSANASDHNDKLSKLWSDILRGCDEGEARKDLLPLLPQVARGEQYRVARDVFRQHGCSEADLRAAIERDQQRSPNMQSPVLACAQLLPQYARQVAAANPNADSAVKMMAVERLMAMVGCGSLPPPQTTSPQVTNCIDLGAGMVTCHTY